MHARVRLGHSPIEVVPLGVGCWAWGDQRYWRYEEDHGPRDVVGAFDACVEAGLDLFDTAEAYGSGKSEQIARRAGRRSGRVRWSSPPSTRRSAAAAGRRRSARALAAA